MEVSFDDDHSISSSGIFFYHFPFLILNTNIALVNNLNAFITYSSGTVMSCDYCNRIKGPAITVKMKYNDLINTVDFAPIVRDQRPIPPKACWPRRAAQWPTATTAAYIKEGVGINWVAKDSLKWIVSFQGLPQIRLLTASSHVVLQSTKPLDHI